MANRAAPILLSLAGAAVLVHLLCAGLAAADAAAVAIVISEVGWGGTAADSQHEWIELYNPGTVPVDLSGWRIVGQHSLDVHLEGVVEPAGFYLLERATDGVVADVAADLLYSGGLTDSGEALFLLRPDGSVADSANGDGGPWPGGTSYPDFLSMVRIVALEPGSDDNWTSHYGDRRNGVDANGEPIQGTPRQPNPGWDLDNLADLVLHKSGPPTAEVGADLTYTISATNLGTLTAENVRITDTLPAGLHYVTDTAATQPIMSSDSVLAWSLSDLGPGQTVSFSLVVALDVGLAGTVSNAVAGSTDCPESRLDNNSAQAETWLIDHRAAQVLIEALVYDGYELNDTDEAVLLVNVGAAPASLAGWQLTDGLSSMTFPSESTLEPAERVWIAAHGDAFARQFGHLPDFEVHDSGLGIPPMGGGPWPGFANDGDEAILVDQHGRVQDVLVYGSGDVLTYGWNGPALEPYVVSGVFAAEGQILYRKMNPLTGLPVTDTNSALDWAQERTNPVTGRRVRYPGWDMEHFVTPQRAVEEATLTVAIAPDHAYEVVVEQLTAAESSIQVESLTMRSVAIGDALGAAAQRGVAVTVLLEGGPVGGLDDQEKLACERLEASGGQCWFMVNDTKERIHDRYAYLHAKFMVIDGAKAIISTENFSPDSMPDDDKADGTWGRRGAVLVTDAASVVARLSAVWQADFDPGNHRDLRRWSSADLIYGSPPAGTLPIASSGGTTYTVYFSQPLVLHGSFAMELSHVPENSLRAGEGALGLLERAGSGDTVLVEALNERPYWGPSSSTPELDPNPRLEALMAAAMRGATVRLLLDPYYDDRGDPVSNRATCQSVNLLALDQGLDLACAQNNRTGLGIHNKMLLAHVGGQGYIQLGSINGTELSNKGNREISLLVQSDAAFEWLARMFWIDWPYHVRLPIVYHHFKAPARYVLISEVLYDPSGPDDAEFIELVNPTEAPINLTGFGLGDAVNRDDFEDLRRFPAGTWIQPGKTLVVAASATGFQRYFGFDPDFEILNSDEAVADMLDDPTWGHPDAFLQLGNTGDEVLLRDADDRIVDAIAYGQGQVPGVVSCPLAPSSGHSLERVPYNMDSDNCAVDFRIWPFPSPGTLP
jgi:uncharacterized repeat protein (TIGR01451 family)